MEVFSNFDWTTDINDIINDVFVSEERLLKESVMYKLISGTFKDPFGIVRFEEMSIKPPVNQPEKGPEKTTKKRKYTKRKNSNVSQTKDEQLD